MVQAQIVGRGVSSHARRDAMRCTMCRAKASAAFALLVEALLDRDFGNVR
jgi:hypothetical protein